MSGVGIDARTYMVALEAALAAWSVWMVAAGRPQSTIGLRVYHVRRVLGALGRPPAQVSTGELLDYLAAQRWAPETRRAYRSSLRGFFGWLQAAGERVDNPAAALPPIALPRALPRPAPDDVYREALHRADERTRLMLQLAAVCGLRRAEIAGLRRDHVTRDLLGWSLRITGKGGHTRLVPLPDYLGRQLVELPHGWVFPSPAGGHLTPAHVGKLVSRVLPPGWTCHTLRHRCATVAYAATRDLRAIQELLGHAKPETTARYTQVPVESVRAAVRAAAG